MKKTTSIRKTNKGFYSAGAFWLGLLLLFAGRPAGLLAQCSPDITPPVCTAPADMTITSATWISLNIDLFNMPDDLPKVRAAFGNATHWDNCDQGNSNLQESFYIYGPSSAPTKIQRRFFATDAAGNVGEATQLITIAQCSPDITSPVCTAPADMTITGATWISLNIDLFNMPDDLPKVRAAFGNATHWDNCDQGNSNLQESFYIYGPSSAPTKIQRRFFATDAAGNVGEATQLITIAGAYTMHVPAWRYPGQPNVDTMTLAGEFGHVLYDPEDSVFTAPCVAGYSKIERDWSFVDWLYQPGGNGTEGALPALDLNNDGITGDAYDIIAIGDSVWLYQNNAPTQALMKRATALSYKQILYNSYLLRGTVHLDTLQNCTLDAGEPGLADFKVKAIGQVTQNVYTGFTGTDGVFELLVCPEDTLVELGLDLPYNYGGTCPSTHMTGLGAGPIALRNIAVPLNSSCRLLTVDIATLRLRPCMAGSYWVNYCNYSDQLVAATYVDVLLDTFVQYQSATLPGNLLSGNTYRFNTGNLTPGACGQFRIDILLGCDAPAGMTHCTEAHIFPTDNCPPPLPWSGADLRASGQCDGDSIRFLLRNVGSGTMANPLDFVVTEDLIMSKTAAFQLGPGGTLLIVAPANGATWRIESPQEPGHPWGGVAAAVVEGCDGLNTPGLVNVFPVNDPDPFSSVDCTENTSSFDPNDKQAFPKGYGSDRFIAQNTDIEYLVNFQNTGTDTAFTVVILDTISSNLNPATVRPGASSHRYDFDRMGNVLRFRFDNILLPDSNTNAAASHGFVKFRIPQQPDNPVGTGIVNSASIYFDFNAPVRTNHIVHTVGKHFILVSTGGPGGTAEHLRAYPNPATESVFFTLPSVGGSEHTFVLADAMGRTVAERQFAGYHFRFDCGLLPAGTYWFRITSDDRKIYFGKMMIR